MTRVLRLAAALVLLAAAAPPREDPAATFTALRAVDARMAAIAYRLVTANAPLCRDLVPVPGWAIHSLGQYDPALRVQARAAFGFETPIAVEAVVPDSPAARANIAAGDSIAAINSTPLAGTPRATADSSARDAANAVVARQPVAAPLRVELLRAGVRRTAGVVATPGCPGSFEILLGPGMDASADGRIVQVAVRFFERYTDDQVAVVVAHEL
ncbi:MAG TPA: PDZ domain-containing protein, partial [Sphingomonas sp.]|nr:PDZ domain-containing protein [Sphingomonas sp.]